ncbi:MAG: hypothetical protein KUG65_05810 [Sphingomonadaceae bacterium]|nr:hypothetical protein [Sphingomonadaceae bacterium]
MRLLNKKLPDPDAAANALPALARSRVKAAERLDAAIVEVEAAIGGLLDADDAFFAAVRSSGASDHGTGGHLRRVLRTLLMGQMQVTAPGFVRFLGIPFVSARAQGSIAAAVDRTANNDLANHTLVEETVA